MSVSLRPRGLQPTRLLCSWSFIRQEYCNGLPYLPPGDLPSPMMEARSLALQADSLPTESPGKPTEWVAWRGVGTVRDHFCPPFSASFPTALFCSSHLWPSFLPARSLPSSSPPFSLFFFLAFFFPAYFSPGGGPQNTASLSSVLAPWQEAL